MKRLSRPFLIASAFLSLALPAFAGWVETDREGGQTLFSEGKIKDVGDGGTWNVFDTVGGELMLVDDGRQIYTRAPIEAYCRAIKEAADQALSRMSPEERAMMQQMMGAMMGGKPGSGKSLIRITSLGQGGKIAGFDTEKYQVKVNGRIYEELWLAPSAPVVKELDIRGLQKYQKEMSGCLEKAAPLGFPTAPGPEESREYERLLRKGWVMRSIQYDENGARGAGSEVRRLEKRAIPPSEFSPPAGYRQVTVDRFMTGGE